MFQSIERDCGGMLRECPALITKGNTGCSKTEKQWGMSLNIDLKASTQMLNYTWISGNPFVLCMWMSIGQRHCELSILGCNSWAMVLLWSWPCLSWRSWARWSPEVPANLSPSVILCFCRLIPTVLSQWKMAARLNQVVCATPLLGILTGRWTTAPKVSGMNNPSGWAAMT